MTSWLLKYKLMIELNDPLAQMTYCIYSWQTDGRRTASGDLSLRGSEAACHLHPRLQKPFDTTGFSQEFKVWSNWLPLASKPQTQLRLCQGTEPAFGPSRCSCKACSSLISTSNGLSFAITGHPREIFDPAAASASSTSLTFPSKRRRAFCFF